MSIPHYTLINKDGLVVKNAIHRDSLEHYIKAQILASKRQSRAE